MQSSASLDSSAGGLFSGLKTLGRKKTTIASSDIDKRRGSKLESIEGNEGECIPDFTSSTNKKRQSISSSTFSPLDTTDNNLNHGPIMITGPSSEDLTLGGNSLGLFGRGRSKSRNSIAPTNSIGASNSNVSIAQPNPLVIGINY